MRGVFSAIAVFLCLAGSVFGNVKKVVFLGPGQTRAFSYALDTRLRTSLESLSSDQPRLRRKLHAKFPLSPSLGEPSEAWFLLSKLAHRKRHEVRVCWPATVGQMRGSPNFSLKHCIATNCISACPTRSIHSYRIRKSIRVIG